MNNDREFVGVNFIEDPDIIKRWKQFWPQTGSSQNWDALGKIDYGDHSEWMLVEAKAHLEEVQSSCSAKSPKSIEMIKESIKKTMHSFCADEIPIDNWLSPYYQFANPLVSLHFLIKECDPAEPARLLFVYFYGDHRPDTDCPQREEDWHPIIDRMEDRLRIDQKTEIMSRIHHLFLPVNPS